MLSSICTNFLYYIALHCTVLYRTAQYCAILYCNALHCTAHYLEELNAQIEPVQAMPQHKTGHPAWVHNIAQYAQLPTAGLHRSLGRHEERDYQ